MNTTIDHRPGFFIRISAMLFFVTTGTTALLAQAPEKSKIPEAPRRPHIVTLRFLISSVITEDEAGNIISSLKKLKGLTDAHVDPKAEIVDVTFDSHAVSYHQVAQAIATAGDEMKKVLDPRLKIRVPEYAEKDNAARVDAIFAGKRLNQHVHIETIDKSTGRFIVHFLPLTIDPKESGPQGFNGGHLNHPIHDPQPRGLGLTFIYVSE